MSVWKHTTCVLNLGKYYMNLNISVIMLFFFSAFASASLSFDLSGYPGRVTLLNATEGKHSQWGVESCGAGVGCKPSGADYLTSPNNMLIRLSFGGRQYYYVVSLPSDGSVCVTDAANSVIRTPEQVKSFVNNRTGNYVGSWNGSTPIPSPGVVREATLDVWGEWTNKYKVKMSCRFSFGAGDGWGGEVEIVNPPAPAPSLCSLNNQTINMNMSKNELNVTGLTGSGNVNILCSSGTPSNYTLRLTGSNVVDGRLSFGNGVSAQITLNGTQVAANGPRITLPNLGTTSLPLSASLVGTASAPGVTNANGILVLEAL